MDNENPIRRVILVRSGDAGGTAYDSLEAALADELAIPENVVCEWMTIIKATELVIDRSRQAHQAPT